MNILKIIPLCGGLLLTGCVAVTTVNNEENTLQAITQKTNLNRALLSHDATALYNAGVELQKYEARAKVVDAVYNSQNVYRMAAISAAGQGNTAVLNQVIDASPACKPFAAYCMTTRSTAKNVTVAIPQLVEVTFGGWDKLTPAQAPIWGDYIMAFYPALNRSQAKILANRVNNSRCMMAADSLAEVAVALGNLEGKDVPAAFRAKNVFSNAVDMAVFLKNKEALTKIIALYDKASFKETKIARELAGELKGMAKTRSVLAASLPGDVNAGMTVRQARNLLVRCKTPADSYVEAMGMRDTKTMFSFAKEVKASDSQLSEKMLESCALFAALQQKKALFREICAEYPQGKKFQNFLSGAKQPSLLPQIVKVRKAEEINTLPTDFLASWEPFFASFFVDVSEKDFSSIARQVNEARWNLDAEKMADAAGKIANLKMKKDAPKQLSAAAVLKEAMLFAEISRDISGYEKCMEIGKAKKILQNRELKEAELTLKSFAVTRGQYVNVRTTQDVRARSVYRNGMSHTQLQIGDDTQVEIGTSSDDENFIVLLILLPFQILAEILKILI